MPTPYNHQEHVDAVLNRNDNVDPNKDPGFAGAVLGAQEQISNIMRTIHDSTTTPAQAAAKLAEADRIAGQPPLAGK